MEKTLDPESFSPNKRPKIKPETLTLTPEISPFSSKGKAPISDDDEADADESPADIPPQNCGICFCEQGNSVRGLIDCCDHYFCFLCIIEWSKIESRCPLCRGRFGSVRRLRKDGTVIGNGFVRIPVRDQFDDPFNEPSDPYAHARCTVCSGTSDESLLLLCDLCDTALHTYCVGLGYTVPEGDWFCQDCALLQAEQHDNEINENVDNSNDSSSINPKHLDEESSTKTSVSIFDFVRDPTKPRLNEHGLDRLRKLVSPTKKFSCPANASAQANVVHPGSLRNVTESSARTLQNCRNVHQHINVLRDNWDSFRTGSLGFSSSLAGTSRKGGGKSSLVGKHTEKLHELRSSSTQSSSQSNKQGTSGNSVCRKNPYDVEKAWKLMNIAKSMKQVGKTKSASKTASVKVHSDKAKNVASNCASFKVGMQSPIQKLRGTLPKRSGNHMFTGSFPEGAISSSCKPQNSSISGLSLSGKVQTPSRADSYCRQACLPSSCGKPIVQTSDLALTKLNIDKKEVASGTREQVRSADNCSNREAKEGPAKNIGSASFRPIVRAPDISCSKLYNKEIFTNSQKQLRDADNYSTSEAVLPNSAQANINDREYSPSTQKLANSQKQLRDADNYSTSEAVLQNSAQANINDREYFPSAQKLAGGLFKVFDECKGSACSTSPHLPREGAVDASCGKSQGKKVPACPSETGAKISSKVSKNDEAKGEIQSLVKLNLKLLSKDRRLETDAFKDIARLSTHTILAACGFEHREIVRPCPTLECNHSTQIKQQRRSTLMPSSCRECFYLFVNNVVTSIMSQKLTSSGVAC